MSQAITDARVQLHTDQAMRGEEHCVANKYVDITSPFDHFNSHAWVEPVLD